MPVLAADGRSLPDAALHRAATVLGILGHAYVHVSPPDRVELPPSVAAPWGEVRRRLGRAREPVLAYTDLIVNNWRVAGAGDPPLRVGNLRLLVRRSTTRRNASSISASWRYSPAARRSCPRWRPPTRRC
jgi:hypothetical protein